MNKKLLADNFTGVYPVTKMLRFKLIPQGKTQEFIERDGIIDIDTHRTESYHAVTEIIKRYHMKFIEDILSNLELDGLNDFYNLYILSERTQEEDDNFENLKTSLRKQVVKNFTEDKRFKTLFKKELITNDLPEFIGNNDEELELVNEFSKFTSYFTNFHKCMARLYSDEEKMGTIGYRTIDQNLPKYFDNIKIFEMLMNSEICNDVLEYEKQLQDLVNIKHINEFFNINGFKNVISQKGIDIYNTIIGGFTLDEKTHVKGLNTLIQEYNKKNSEKKIPLLNPLFKQILSEKESFSFLYGKFHSDEELIESINKFYENLEEKVFSNEESFNIAELINNINNYNKERIYIRTDSINIISNEIFQGWWVLSKAIEDNYDKENNASIKKKNTKTYLDKRKRELKKIKQYSIHDLNNIASKYLEKNIQIENYFISNVNKLENEIRLNYSVFQDVLLSLKDYKKSLRKNTKFIESIKQFLDSVIKLEHTIKPLIMKDAISDKDELFYTELVKFSESLTSISLLYNKTRNYITEKPYSLEKVKLNFNKPTLLGGWDKNKEKENLGVIFLKNGLYYLGIINSQCTGVLAKAPHAITDKCYRKMEYKLLPGPNKMLPKVMFAKSNLEKYCPSEEIINKYKKGTYKKGKNFNLQDCHELIDFFKDGIQKNPDWAQFDFKFTDTCNYTDISGFYREVEQQGYKLTYQDIDESYINELVEHGQLYLFQIYNKDFSQWSKGKPNLHTLYWNTIFSPENLKDIVIKLNGGAEIYYRKASIEEDDIITHEANIAVKNKNPYNEKKESLFPYVLTKDKRFTVDQYQFHVPITLNFKSKKENYLNQKVNQLIYKSDDINIIGVSSDKNHLLYISVIDMQGNIIEQKSMNAISKKTPSGTLVKENFKGLLDRRIEENKNAIANWQNIQTVKEIKEGYLGLVVHEIAKLMLKYNAIVILEDTNFGYKKDSKVLLEKSVYQKFEKMLIDKLNYLVDKDKNIAENGSVLHAYQLTNKFESMQRIGKQSGFLYYVRVFYTDNMDPTTGFVNFIYEKYESVDKSIEFIKKFDRITFNKSKSYFEFDIDFSKFTYKEINSRVNWTLCSAGERTEHYYNSSSEPRLINLTNEFYDLFNKYNISLDVADLKEQIVEIKEKEFYTKFYRLFRLMVQVKDYNNTGLDKIVSPVINNTGRFFDSSNKSSDVLLPTCIAANSAYNIARKGLFLVNKIKATNFEELDKVRLTITNDEWLNFAQNI